MTISKPSLQPEFPPMGFNNQIGGGADVRCNHRSFAHPVSIIAGTIDFDLYVDLFAASAGIEPV